MTSVQPTAPDISVIIPVYNGAATIAQAIKSVQRQNHANLEIIVVDDASTDETATIVQALAQSDARIRLIIQENNSGVSAARNRAIKASQGIWLAVLDADDWYEPDRLKKLRQAAEIQQADVILDNLLIFDHATGNIHNATNFFQTESQPVRITLERLFAADNPLRVHSAGYAKPFMRREVLLRSSLNYNTRFQLGEDFLLLAELLFQQAKIVAIPEAYYVYRHRISPSTGAVSPFSRSPGKVDQIIEISRYIRDRYAGCISQELLKVIWRRENYFKNLRQAATIKELMKQHKYWQISHELFMNVSVTIFILQMSYKSFSSRRINFAAAPRDGGLAQTLLADMRVLNARGSNNLWKFLRLLARPGFLAVVLYRLAAACYQHGMIGRVLASICSRLNLTLTGCDINNQAIIGPGFKLPHPNGVVIGIARIGSNVMMLQNTTLGMRRFTDSESDQASYPIVGDNVVLCCGAVVAGPVKVGNGVIVGANAVVLQDVPDNHTAVGSPARFLIS